MKKKSELRKAYEAQELRANRLQRLKGMTEEIEQKTAEWTALDTQAEELGNEIEELQKARQRYAKRYKLPIPKEDANVSDSPVTALIISGHYGDAPRRL